MERAKFEGGGAVAGDPSLSDLFAALAPTLYEYGLVFDPGEWMFMREGWRSAGDDGQHTFGDGTGAHLAMTSSYYGGCGYDTPCHAVSVVGVNLVHRDTGAALGLEIFVTDYIYPPSDLTVRLEGDAETIDRMKAAVTPVLDAMLD